jgi:hypothetical protein
MLDTDVVRSALLGKLKSAMIVVISSSCIESSNAFARLHTYSSYCSITILTVKLHLILSMDDQDAFLCLAYNLLGSGNLGSGHDQTQAC